MSENTIETFLAFRRLLHLRPNRMKGQTRYAELLRQIIPKLERIYSRRYQLQETVPNTDDSILDVFCGLPAVGVKTVITIWSDISGLIIVYSFHKIINNFSIDMGTTAMYDMHTGEVLVLR